MNRLIVHYFKLDMSDTSQSGTGTWFYTFFSASFISLTMFDSVQYIQFDHNQPSFFFF